jgi:hypothetical protein
VLIMTYALVRTDAPLTKPVEAGFNFSGFRVFTTVPDHRDYGIAALRGMVVVYDERPLHQEGVIAGNFYVRESQRPRSGMAWDSWLQRERDDQRRRASPASPLAVQREVVQAIRWRDDRHWAVRMSSGFVDGPYADWAFGIDLIGKVVGIYLPATSKGEC